MGDSICRSCGSSSKDPNQAVCDSCQSLMVEIMSQEVLFTDDPITPQDDAHVEEESAAPLVLNPNRGLHFDSPGRKGNESPIPATTTTMPKVGTMKHHDDDDDVGTNKSSGNGTSCLEESQNTVAIINQAEETPARRSRVHSVAVVTPHCSQNDELALLNLDSPYREENESTTPAPKRPKVDTTTINDHVGTGNSGHLSCSKESQNPIAISGSTPANSTPARSSTQQPLAVVGTPPSSSQNNSPWNGLDMVLSVNIPSVSAAIIQSLVEAQIQESILLEVKVHGLPTAMSLQGRVASITTVRAPSHHQLATSLTMVHAPSQHSPAPGGGGNVTPSPYSALPVPNSKTCANGTCVSCGQEKEDIWRKLCIKCYAKSAVEHGRSTYERGKCNHCGKKTELDWMYLCRKCYAVAPNQMNSSQDKGPENNNKNDDNHHLTQVDEVDDDNIMRTTTTTTTTATATCQDCKTATLEFPWYKRCQQCFQKWRESHVADSVNKGGKCRFCAKELTNVLQTCCGTCFEQHYKTRRTTSSTSASSSSSQGQKCPSCGTLVEPGMIWCTLCYYHGKKQKAVGDKK